MDRPICFRLFWHWARAAASRTFCTAGTSSPIRIAMIAMTTSNSISVKPRLRKCSQLNTRMVKNLLWRMRKKHSGNKDRTRGWTKEAVLRFAKPRSSAWAVLNVERDEGRQGRYQDPSSRCESADPRDELQ